MSANEREVRLRFTSNTGAARADVRAFTADLNTQFGSVNRLGIGAMRGLNTEFAALSRHVPVVGGALSHVTRELLSMGTAVRHVSEMETAFRRFQTVLGQMGAGGNAAGATLLRNLGIDIQAALRNPQPAFQTFITALRGMQTQAGQTALAVNVLGANVGSQLLPALQQAQGAAQGASSGLAAMRSSIGPLLGVFALAAAGGAALSAAIFKASESWSEFGDSVFKAMQKTGQSAEQLSVIKFATEELRRSNAGASVSFDQVVRGIARYEANVSRGVTNPSRQAAQALTALGLSAQELKNMTPDAAFRTLMEHLDGVKNRMDRDRAAADLFGRDFQNLIPIMDTLGKHFDETKARAEAMGLIFSGKSAAQARQFQQTLKDLELSGKGLAVMFGAQVGPEITKAMQAIMQAVQALGPVIIATAKAVAGWIQANVVAIQLLVVAFRAIPATILVVNQALGTAARAFGNLGATVKSAAEGLLLFATGNYGGAAVMFGDAWKKAAVVGSEAVAQFTTDFGNYRHELKKIVADVFTPTRLPEISQGDDDIEFPGKKKKDTAAEKARREAIKQLKEEQEGIEEDYRRHIEVLQREYEQLIVSSQTYTKSIVDEADKRLKGLEDSLNRELALAKKQSEIDDINNRRQKAQDERDKVVAEAQNAQHKREIEAFKKHREALLDEADKYDELRAASVKARAEIHATTYEDAEEKIYDIQVAAFNRRLQALRDDEAAFYKASKDINDVNLEVAQEFSDKIGALVAEQERREREHYEHREEARQKDLDRETYYLNRLFELQQQYQEQDKDFRREDIERGLESPFRRTRITAIAERVGLEVEEANARERINDRRLENEKKRITKEYELQHESIKNTEEYNATLLEIEEGYEALRRQNHEKADRERRRSVERGNKEAERLDPNSSRSRFGDVYGDVRDAGGSRMQALGATAADIFGKMSEAAGNFRDMAVSALQQFNDAVGQTISNYILLGNTGGQSFRKFAAQVIASVAAMAAVKAVWEVAEGIAELAKAWANPLNRHDHIMSAVHHFKAAAGYAVLSGVAAVAGRQIAGNAFAEGGAGGAGGTGEDNAPRNATFNYGAASPSTPSSSDLSPGSRGVTIFARMADKLDALDRRMATRDAQLNGFFSRVQFVPTGHVVAMGAGEYTGQQAIGVAFVRELADNHQVRADVNYSINAGRV